MFCLSKFEQKLSRFNMTFKSLQNESFPLDVASKLIAFMKCKRDKLSSYVAN